MRAVRTVNRSVPSRPSEAASALTCAADGSDHPGRRGGGHGRLRAGGRLGDRRRGSGRSAPVATPAVTTGCASEAQAPQDGQGPGSRAQSCPPHGHVAAHPRGDELRACDRAASHDDTRHHLPGREGHELHAPGRARPDRSLWLARELALRALGQRGGDHVSGAADSAAARSGSTPSHGRGASASGLDRWTGVSSRRRRRVRRWVRWWWA